MGRLRLLTFALALVAAAGAVAARQQSPPASPRFRSVADLIQVDVSVLDSRRQPVKGLTAADFVVIEKGRERVVEAFTAIDLPDGVSPADATAWISQVPSDVATNQSGAEEGRIVVILMDRTIPPGQATQTAQRVAAAAVEALGPGDLGALVSTSGGVPVNLTSDRDRLVRAVGQRDWSTGSSTESREIEASLGGAVEAETGSALTDLSSPLIDGRCLCGLCVLETITNVAQSLESMPRRRKSLLFVGSNLILQYGQMPTPPGSPVEPQIGCDLKLRDARDAMWRALDRSGITIHSIDPGGLQVVGPTAQASSTIRGAAGRGAFASAVQENLQAQGTLGVLPERTGGRVVMNTNGPEERVPDIVRESASYYVLGFRPSEPLVPGEVREISVRVNRRDVKVHARKQYVVPAPPAVPATAAATRESLGTAIRATLPVADTRVAMAAAAFASRSGTSGTVAVTLDLTAVVAAADLSADAAVPVSVAVAAYDRGGRPLAASDGIVSVPRADGSRPERIETLVRLDLPPGEHEIRAAVAVQGTGLASSVFAPVTVPSFASLPLALSHISLAAGRGTVTVPPDLLGDEWPVVPTTRRVFRNTETVQAVMRIYQGVLLQNPIEPVTMTGSILDASGAVRMRQTLEFQPAEFGRARTAEAKLTLPVARLSPGEYVFSVEARKGERVAGRAVRFEVE